MGCAGAACYTWREAILQQFDQLVRGQTRMAEDRAQRAFGDLLVVGDRNPTKGLGALA